MTGDTIFETGAREEKLLIALSVPTDDLNLEMVKELLQEHVNWPFVMMGAMQHRTLSMLWENVKAGGLMEAVIQSGLTKNWIFYADTLSRASLERNTLWLRLVDDLAADFERDGVPLVVIKGGALIGDIYHAGNRMLGDIDTLAPREHSDQIVDFLEGRGFIQGQIDPVTSTIQPMPRDQKRFWTLYAHALPKFTYPTGDDRYPFLRFAVGFDFYDPTDEHRYSSETVIANRIPREGSNIWVPDDADTIVCLCSHVYREGVSANFAYAGENWHLWKFCDLRQALMKPYDEAFKKLLVERVKAANLEIPYYFAVHHTYLVYGDDELLSWLDLVDVGQDRSFLSQLIDGDQRHDDPRSFNERLFDSSRIDLGRDQPLWAKVMANGEWW